MKKIWSLIIILSLLILMLFSCSQDPNNAPSNYETDTRNIDLPLDEDEEDPIILYRNIIGMVAMGSIQIAYSDWLLQSAEVTVPDRTGMLLETVRANGSRQYIVEIDVTSGSYPLYVSAETDIQTLTMITPFVDETVHRANINEITTAIAGQQPQTASETTSAKRYVLTQRFGLDEQGEALFIDVFTKG